MASFRGAILTSVEELGKIWEGFNSTQWIYKAATTGATTTAVFMTPQGKKLRANIKGFLHRPHPKKPGETIKEGDFFEGEGFEFILHSDGSKWHYDPVTKRLAPADV